MNKVICIKSLAREDIIFPGKHYARAFKVGKSYHIREFNYNDYINVRSTNSGEYSFKKFKIEDPEDADYWPYFYDYFEYEIKYKLDILLK